MQGRLGRVQNLLSSDRATSVTKSIMRLVPAKAGRRVTFVAIVAGATMLADCRAVSHRLYRPPTVALRNVAVNGIGATGGSLRVSLLVRNPNFYSLNSA